MNTVAGFFASGGTVARRIWCGQSAQGSSPVELDQEHALQLWPPPAFGIVLESAAQKRKSPHG
ncbi:MAG TPA: hypothetical protein PLM95_15155 [Ottowia sp.]|jgi:hypothetical protein|uniref:hypothetical protein n=1 Tax=Ottowia sp. TaxID=1898956 RepID=UPI002C6BE619|nr:hypothetical protein [Ottowia sp.]HRN08161.1 hypothetical protein [Ottowia sp.]